MSMTGLDVFDKTIHITNTWLGEIERTVGPHRQLAWHALGAVLRTLRDRLTVGLAAHLGAQLPLLVRGAYYDQWRPSEQPTTWRSYDEFVALVARGLDDTRPVDPKDAIQSVFRVLNHHITPDQLAHVREALPEDVRKRWPEARAAAE